MKVLLTGYTGFLGRHLARALRAAGHDLRAVLHRTAIPRRDLEEGVELLWGQLEDPETARRAVAGVDAVVHSAWLFQGRGAERPTPNERAAEALIAAAREAGVGVFAFVSSVAVYGVSRVEGASLREDAHLAGDRDLRFVYPSEKVAVERLLTERKPAGMRLGILRPGPIFDDGKPPAVKKIIRKGGRAFAVAVGNGRNRMPHVHAADVADGVVRWLAKGGDGAVYNLTPTADLTQAIWMRRWGAARGERVVPVYLTPAMVRAMARAAGWLKAKMGKPDRSDPEYVIASATRNLAYSNDRARAELGWIDRETERVAGARTRA